ncbi:MAG TPA: hypothetical protein VFR09_01735 [Alphaproteobacteria bacterium]|nr:hypothetical protein [Alphaproteobacteria bacterium]
MKPVLSLVVVAMAMSVAACSPCMTAQRAPDLLMPNAQPVQGRTVPVNPNDEKTMFDWWPWCDATSVSTTSTAKLAPAMPATQQRAPAMLYSTTAPVQGRNVTPEANNYQEWLGGSPNMSDDDATGRVPQVITPAPSQRPVAPIRTNTPTNSATVYGERITVEQSYPTSNR